MNVKFTDGKEKTVLLGCKYLDDRNQVLFQQAASGWVKHSGKGWIVYLQMGHTAQEFMNPVYAHMILNAITWKPKP
jgi:type 1 glutamine amidotransferase